MAERILSDDEYAACQSLVLVLARKLEELPLAPMLERIARAHAVAPILDPTLYRRGVDNLEQITSIVRALRRAQDECREPMANLRQWAAATVAEVAE